MRTHPHGAEVRARLERLAVVRDGAISPAEAKARMDARARRFAAAPVAVERAETCQVVTFALDGERYAIETRWIREVVRLGGVTRVPGTPACILGLTTLRGELLPVVDVRQLFGFPSREPTERARVAVLGEGGDEMGMIMDAVEEVTTVRADELLRAPSSVHGVETECVRGVTRDGCIVLDGERLLAEPRLFAEHGRESGSAPAQGGAA